MKWGPRTLQPSYALLYYRAAHKVPKEVRPHPPGLKVVTNQNSHVTWRCLAGKWATSPPTRCSNGTLVVRVRFPDCSNGKLDSADHRSHMAYASGGRCPGSHPVALPMMRMMILYNAVGPGAQVSSGRLTEHGDFVNAWDQDALVDLVRRMND